MLLPLPALRDEILLSNELASVDESEDTETCLSFNDEVIPLFN